MFDVVVVCGPTASGKSEIGMNIADKFGGEIISADSMQIYREMNIGTAKPSSDDMKKIRHHLVGCVSVCDEYNVSRFVNDATLCIDDVLQRGKLPVIVGGTGLYIDSLINNVNFEVTENDKKIREYVKNLYEEFGADYIYDKLFAIDKEAAESIHKNNIKRVTRALELNLLTGKNLAQINAESLRERKYNPLFIGVNYRNRELLYSRINARVDKMLDEGLLQEVLDISEMNLSATALGAIGYKEFFEYIDGKITLENAIETLKQKTRNYAKRQITWFKRNDEINWFYPDDFDDRDSFAHTVLDFINTVGV